MDDLNPPIKPDAVFLLAVWGKSYIEKFFNFSLKSFLAAGNIPEISKEYNCTFLFLTTAADVPYFKAQPAFSRLSSYCKVEFIEISDLIFDGSYSATLTLAYERGMRSREENMCSTYFFFLVSDYILTNGSLANVGRLLKKGYSGVTTGNFLVVEENFAPLLESRMDHENHVLQINPREMLALAFQHMHPVSVAQTVTQSFTHASHANRLFWKVDEKNLVGRFYLRHMLCIKPERKDYTIGASCDYSFIPEMCPSGNILHIQDSDDYCVIEMAPYEYEKQFIHPGPYNEQSFAEKLSEWTNALHRKNAHIPIIFHSEELKEKPVEMIEKSSLFIQSLENKLSLQPQPIYGHPYWRSCVQDILNVLVRSPKKEKYFGNKTFAGLIGSPVFSPKWSEMSQDHFLLTIEKPQARVLSKKNQRKAKIRDFLIGNSLFTKPWHLDWIDDRELKIELTSKIAKNTSYAVLAFEPILQIISWLEKQFPKQGTYFFYDFLKIHNLPRLKECFRDKKHIVIWLTEDYLDKLGPALRECMKFFPEECSLSIHVRQSAKVKSRFKKNISIALADIANTQFSEEKIQFHYSYPRYALSPAVKRYSDKLFKPNRSLGTRVIGFTGLSVLSAISLLGNVRCLYGAGSKKRSTSVTLNFKYGAKKHFSK